MKKRIFFISFLLTSLAIYATAATGIAAFKTPAAETLSAQSSHSLTLEKYRGTIYDRNLQKLTNSDSILKAVCFPTEEVFKTLKFNSVNKFHKDELKESSLPFALQVSHILDCDGIFYYESPQRYSGLCTHLIGYTSQGAGITGIEKIFEDKLHSNEELRFQYTADALGRAIPAERAEVKGGTGVDTGIALTIDKDIQLIAEEAAKLIDKGAVVVTEIATGDIVALVSRPDYDPENVVNFLHNDNSPLLDRSLSSYTPGSVFKLVISATALEKGIDPKEKYLCQGSIDVEGMEFHCYGNKAHGEVNLHTALQNSCNCYFIRLGEKLSLQDIYAMALSLGLGTGTELYPGLEGDSGYIGSIPELKNKRALANFAIGQGDVLVSPIQMAALVGCIARGGVYSIPNILEGFVDEELNVLEKNPHGSVRVMSSDTAQTLRNYMESTVKFGTGRGAYSDSYHAGAKTGTAQTGVFVEGKEKLNFWFCGYAGKTEVPEYGICVLREGASDGINPTPEVFGIICEKLL